MRYRDEAGEADPGIPKTRPEMADPGMVRILIPILLVFQHGGAVRGALRREGPCGLAFSP